MRHTGHTRLRLVSQVIGTPCPERKLCASISHFMQPYYGRSNEPKKRGLQWPIRRNPEYRSLTEVMHASAQCVVEQLTAGDDPK